jgi:hypothetical protein
VVRDRKMVTGSAFKTIKKGPQKSDSYSFH